MRKVILCVAGWRDQSSQASFSRAPSHPYLGSIIGIRATFFFLVEVGTAVVLFLVAKRSTLQRRDQPLMDMEGGISSSPNGTGVLPNSLAIGF